MQKRAVQSRLRWPISVRNRGVHPMQAIIYGLITLGGVITLAIPTVGPLLF